MINFFILYFISRSGEKCLANTNSSDKEDPAYYVTKDFNFKNPPTNARQNQQIPSDNEYDYATQQDLHDHVYDGEVYDFGIAEYAGPIDELPENIYIDPQVSQKQTTDQQALYEVPPNASLEQVTEVVNRLLQQNAELRKRFDNKQ